MHFVSVQMIAIRWRWFICIYRTIIHGWRQKILAVFFFCGEFRVQPFCLWILNPLNTIVLCDVRGCFRGAFNWSPLMPRDASLSDSYKSIGGGFPVYIEKTIFLFPFTLNGIWSWYDSFPFRFSKPNGIPFAFKIERKTVTTIISHSMWKELET